MNADILVCKNHELPRVGVPYYQCVFGPLICCCDPASVFTDTHIGDGAAVTLGTLRVFSENKLANIPWG